MSACGSGSGSGGKPSAGKGDDDKAYESALKFAKCMRDHGIDMPDPQQGKGGGIVMKSGKLGGGPEKSNSIGPDNPKFEAADKECGKYRKDGGGAAESPAEQAKQRDAFIGYSRCMRSKDINMPDPKFSDHGISMMLPKGVRPESAKFKAADKACHPILAAVEPEGMKPGGGPQVAGPAGGSN